jgi:release factor glutamine methyltransferase
MDEARLTVELLLAHVLHRPRIELYTGFELPVAAAELDSFRAVLLRRMRGEPVQYIVGIAHFMGLSFKVDPRVLIPRPETETLVEWLMIWAKDHQAESLRVLDIGTGSGNIAISGARFVKNLHVIGIDLNASALELARLNAADHGVAERVEFQEWDMFEDPPHWLRGGFDAIVSNPPYIPLVEWESLEPHIRNFEPQRALTDGGDGLACCRRIAQLAPVLLKQEGPVACEVGYNQSAEVMDLFAQAGGQMVEAHPDLQRVPRIVTANFIPVSGT